MVLRAVGPLTVGKPAIVVEDGAEQVVLYVPHGVRWLGPAAPSRDRVGMIRAFANGERVVALEMIPWRNHVLHVLSYIVRTYELSPAVLERAARAAKPQRWEALMSTVAEAWMREGKAQGRAEGKAEALLRLLQRRFGPVAESAWARVADGSAAEIDAWFDALLDAQSLTEVFDARPQ